MRASRRMALGVLLALLLQGLAWTMMSGCSLDWSVPEPTTDSTPGVDGSDAADVSVDPSVDPTSEDSGDAEQLDAPFDVTDALVGDAVAPCVEQLTCPDCVACVLAEMGGSTSQCNAYSSCLVGCALWAGPSFDCILWCADKAPVGFQLRLALNGTCTAICGALPPCAVQ